MRRSVLVIALVGGVILSGWFVVRGRGARAEAAPGQAVARNGVQLTVYSQDFALVHEARPMQLAAGANRVRVPEVSKLLDPQSVLLDWKGAGANLPEVVANSYDLGVENGGALLKRYLGKTVDLVYYGDNGREAERKQGTLMVQADGSYVVQTDGKFVVNPGATIEAPVSPDIVTIPQLTVQAESSAAQSADLDVTYLTRGLSWSADYVATLSPSSNTLALECYATVTNRTGVDYPDAKVALATGAPNRAVVSGAVAGEPEEVSKRAAYFADGNAMKAPMGRPSAATPPEAVGDLYTYTIKNPTTLVQERMNRLLMLPKADVPVKMDYSAHAPTLSPWERYDGWGVPNQPVRGSVAVAMSFYNRRKDGLGVPLPHGAVRVYEPDKSGMLRYAGAAEIPDTPNEQKVNLTLARAFDVTTEWTMVKRERVNKRTVRKQVALVLHNENAAPVDLRIVQGFGGRWNVVQESHKHVKLDAYEAQWTVTIPAGAKVTLSYTVELGA